MNELPARELDAMVAEKVMGWSNEEAQNALDCSIGSIAACQLANRDLPEYSTDISAAWSVVEEMRSRGFGISLDDHEDELEFWFLSNPTSLPVGFSGVDKTVARAICLAALETVQG